jgi:dihydrofolate reductase
VILYIAISIDGFIAGEDGNVDWLSSVDNPTQSDNGYQTFSETIDTTLMGRKTYEQVLTFPCPFPYAEKTNYVFTTQQLEVGYSSVRFVNEELEHFIAKLKQEKRASSKHIWLIGGQQLNRNMFQLNLIDRLVVAILPIVLGRGISLFGSMHIDPQQLRYLETHTFPSGCVQITYEKK